MHGLRPASLRSARGNPHDPSTEGRLSQSAGHVPNDPVVALEGWVDTTTVGGVR